MNKIIINYWFNGQEREIIENYTNDFYSSKRFDVSGVLEYEEFFFKGRTHGKRYFKEKGRRKKDSFDIFINGKAVYEMRENFEFFNYKDKDFCKYKEKVVYVFDKNKKIFEDFSERDFLKKDMKLLYLSSNEKIKQDKLTCDLIKYHKNGEIQSKEHFIKGILKSGDYFYDNKQIEKSEKYKGRNGLANGAYIYYNKDGTIKQEIDIVDGNREGNYFFKDDFEEINVIYKKGVIKEGFEKRTYDKKSYSFSYYKDFLEYYKEERDLNEIIKTYKRVENGKSVKIKEFFEIIKGKEVLVNKEYYLNGYEFNRAYKYSELDGQICKNCFTEEFHEIFDKGLNICPNRFKELRKNCPYYLEQVAQLNGKDIGVLE